MPTQKSKNPAPKALHFSKKEAIDFGFKTAKNNIFFYISLFVVIIVINAGLGIIQTSLKINSQGILLFVFTVLRYVVGLIISMGIIKISLEFVGNKKPKLSDLFYTNSLVNYFLVSVVRTLIVIVGLILLIIPGIIFAIKLQFAEYLVVDKNLGVVDALSSSWEMTKGVKWNLFLFWILLLLINILGLLALVVGLIITIPLSMVATAFVYRKLLAQTS